MIRLHNIKIPLDFSDKTLVSAACKKLGTTSAQVSSCKVSKKSVDARKKNEVCFVVSLDVQLKNPADEHRIAARLAPNVGALTEPYAAPVIPKLPAPPALRPVIVGLGPAGLFAALRELDDPRIHQVYARCPTGGGVAYAVQNRLKKAAAFHIVDAEEEV